MVEVARLTRNRTSSAPPDRLLPEPLLREHPGRMTMLFAPSPSFECLATPEGVPFEAREGGYEAEALLRLKEAHHANPHHLSSTGVNLTSVQRAMVEEAISDLERFFGPMIACHVAVSVPHRRPGGAPIAWTCRLGLTVPGQVFTVSRQSKPSFQEAIEDAFDVARRQLQDHAREVRGDVKTRAGEQGPQASPVVAVGPPLPPTAGEGGGIW